MVSCRGGSAALGSRIMPSPLVEEVRRETAHFESQLDRAERLKLARLPFDDLADLGRLYRTHASRLARLRARGDDPAAVLHLNALCVRAHAALYVPTRTPGRADGTRGPGPGLGDVIAATWRAHVLAWALLAAGLLVGVVLGGRDVGALHAFIPAALGYDADRIRMLVSSPEARASFLAPGAPVSAWN